jgi:hypothetical protein
MTADHQAVNGNAGAGLDYDDVTRSGFRSSHLARSALAADESTARQEVQQVLNRAAASADGETLQHLGDQYEQHNHKRGEELSDGPRIYADATDFRCPSM